MCGQMKKGKWKERGPGLSQAGPLLQARPVLPLSILQHFLQSGCSHYPHVAGTETEAGREVVTYLKPYSW